MTSMRQLWTKEHIVRTQLIVVALLAASSASYVFAADAPAAAPASTQPAAAAAFEKIKGLAGEWKGTKKDGGEVATHFKVAANQSAVIEDMHMDMVSVYTLDNDRLVMTHYCAAQN